MIYASFKCDEAKANEIQDFYKAKTIENVPYEVFLVKKEGVTIHAYKNRKGIYTIVFSSSNEEAIEEATLFSDSLTIKNSIEEKKEDKDAYYQGWEDLSYQIGSDEVGVGDFFGPLIVCSTYVKPNDIPFLEKLSINDSKKMSDAYIMTIGEKIRKNIANYIMFVSPKKLSELEDNNFKIHKTMAKVHNLTHIGIKQKYHLNDNIIIYIDQFEREENYRKLVMDDIVKNPLYFRTKGESYYPSVACASVLARYTFLKEWKKMEDFFHTEIPKGASTTVDQVYAKLKKSFPNEVLDQYVKRYFRNYREE